VAVKFHCQQGGNTLPDVAQNASTSTRQLCAVENLDPALSDVLHKLFGVLEVTNDN